MVAEALRLQLEGRLREAEFHYQSVLRRDPGHAEANNGMGALAATARQNAVAVRYFRKAAEARPKDVRYRNNLGNALVLANEVEEAIPVLLSVLEAQPRLYEALCNLGRAYRLRGKADESIPCFRRAIGVAPSKATALLGLAESLVAAGKSGEAEELYRTALATGERPAFALLGLSACRRHTPRDNDLTLIERQIKVTLPGDPALEVLHNAAGKVLLDLGRDAEAFAHFRTAKAGRKTSFSLDAVRRAFTELIACFDRSRIDAFAGMGDPSELPVFVLGMPRSGTTLVEQILASHSHVTGGGELSHLLHLANQLAFSDLFAASTSSRFREKLGALNSASIGQLVRSYLEKLRWHSQTATRITDKMPHNFQLVGLIALILPRARIIHCKRNPIDNCVSIYTNWFNEKHGYADDLATLGAYYREYVRLMAHWTELVPGRILEVQYEDMIRDQEGQTRRLLDFVGLPWEQACLEFHNANRGVTTISRWQVRQPIYSSSVDRWKRFEPLIGELIDALGPLAGDGRKGPHDCPA